MHKQTTTALTSQLKMRYQIDQQSEAGVRQRQLQVVASSTDTREIRNSGLAERGGDPNRIRVRLLMISTLVLGKEVVVVVGPGVVGVEVNVLEKTDVSLHAVDHSSVIALPKPPIYRRSDPLFSTFDTMPILFDT